MHYLQTLPIYIDSFVRLTQQQVQNYDLTKICKPTAKASKGEEKEQIVDLVSTAEQVNGDHKQMNIVAQELVFETPEEEAGEKGRLRFLRRSRATENGWLKIVCRG